jgi:hypothetical protein
VQLTQTLRAGGLSLSAAIRATDNLLNRREVHVHLAQFDSVAAARTALTGIGVAEVRA